MLISHFRVTSWFDTVCNIVARWMNFRENHLHEHELHLSDYNIQKYFDPNICGQTNKHNGKYGQQVKKRQQYDALWGQKRRTCVLSLILKPSLQLSFCRLVAPQTL